MNRSVTVASGKLWPLAAELFVRAAKMASRYCTPYKYKAALSVILYHAIFFIGIFSCMNLGQSGS